MILPLYGDPWFGPYRGDAVETKEKYLIEPVICYWLAEGHGARQRLHPGLSHRHSRARPPLIRREEVYRDQRGDGGPLCARHAGSRAWNTLKITDIVDQLRQQGEGIGDETLAHVSLLPFKHVLPNGTYFNDDYPRAFSQKGTVLPPGRRPKP